VALKNIWTKSSFQLHNSNMIIAALIASSLFTMSPSMAGTVSNVDATENSVTIYFDDVVNKASVFTLSGPNRIAIDVLGATAGGSSSAAGSITSIRQGQFNSETARIVMDLGQPALVTDGQFSQDGRSLTLNLRQADLFEFTGPLGRARQDILPPANFRASPPKRQYEVSAPIGRGAGVGSLPKVFGPTDKSLPLVVIDAGHGGHDPGAISPHNGAREKDVTLAVAKSIRDELLKSGRVRVALTREGDRYLVLQDRYGVARKLGADLFISIHADAAGNPEANGATVYTLSETASDREAQKLAARENKSNIINGVNLGGADGNVSSILIDLTQRETMNVSADFAKVLLRESKPNLTLRSESHKFASFVVLKAPDTPSVLFETGYISNASDAAFLASKSGQQRIGKSVASAIQVHFARRLARR
jgi:N-acetylmuramoyl-L-alanine amidase